LDRWSIERVESSKLPGAVASTANARAVLVTSDDPSILRAVTEQAHTCNVPTIVGCADDTARRRAVELEAEEWFRCPANAEEIAQRIRSAIARRGHVATTRSETADRVEFEQ